MRTNKQNMEEVSRNPWRQESSTVEQYAKYADKYISYNYCSTLIDEFKAYNEFEELALITINNNLRQDVKEIFYNLTKALMKKIEDNEDLFYIIMDLNLVKFTSVKMGRDPYKYKCLISNSCETLNRLHQDLARFILKPNSIKIKKELTDILQDLLSAVDRVDIQFESLKNSGHGKIWWKFVDREYNLVITNLYRPRYNGTYETIADLNLRTLREAARDIVRLLQKLLSFLYKMIPIFNKQNQLIVKRTINSINEIILNFELNLRKECVDVRELIRDSFRDMFDIMKSLKELLFESDIDTFENKQESLNLKEFAHYVATSHMLIFRRCLRRIICLK